MGRHTMVCLPIHAVAVVAYRAELCGYRTAFRASTSPEPYQLFWPTPPWQVCGVPPSRAGKKSYADVSLGHGIGLVACCSAAARASPVLPVALSSSAATPAACGEAIDVPCR